MEERVTVGMKDEAQRLSQKAIETLGAIQLKFDCLPREIANKFAWYAPKAPEERFGNAPLIYEWRLILFFYNADINGQAHFELSSPGWKSFSLTYEEGVLNALSRETCWRELATEIKVAMTLLTEYFESKLRNTLDSLPNETVDLYYRLVGMRGEVDKLELQRNRLSFEAANLELAIKQNIPQLQKAVQDLHNTRSFLGQSKTIKGIRENIEEIVKTLWKIAYPNEPPPATPDVFPPRPWPRNPKASIFGGPKPTVPDDKIALN